MTSRRDISPEVRGLIDEVLNGTISAEGIRRLELALDDNLNAQQFFRDYCQLHINLDAETRAQSVINDFIDRDFGSTCSSQVAGNPIVLDDVTTSDSPQAPSALSFIADCFQSGVNFVSRPAVVVSAGAVCLLMLFLVLAILTRNPEQNAGKPSDKLAVDPSVVHPSDDEDNESEQQQLDGNSPVFVARVTDSHNARWKNSAGKAGDSKRLAIGQRLRLVEGLVEITFDVGAKVLIEGPAGLTIDSSTQATLTYGQLTAQVPEQAIGFTIETPMVNVVDLGTEFGVRVSPKGMTDVAVFSGKVIANPRHIGASAEEAVSVVADEVRRFWSGSIIDEEPLAAPNFTLSIPKAIQIENPSFESPRIDGWLAREVTGWTVVSQPAWPGKPNGGVQCTGEERIQLPATLTGKQWGFIETRKAKGTVHHTSIHQAVGTVLPNTLYRLKVTLGYEAYTTHGLQVEYPFSWDGQDTFEVGLWSGADQAEGPLQPLNFVRNPAPNLKPGKSEVVTMTYRSPSELPPGEQLLFVRMSLAANDWCRVLFDDVQLEAVSIENNWAVRPAE